MLRLFGAPSSACSRPTRRSRRWRTAGSERVELYQLLAAAGARAAVRRLLPRGGRAKRVARRLRRLRPGACEAGWHQRWMQSAASRWGARVGEGVCTRVRRSAPPPVPARACDRRAPLPPAADAPRVARRSRARPASCSAPTRSSARPPSRRICSRGGWPWRPSCWSSSGRSRCATSRGWSATARRRTSRAPSAAATASRRRAFASAALHADESARTATTGPGSLTRGWSSSTARRRAGAGASACRRPGPARR
jgi:hypothetical protein